MKIIVDAILIIIIMSGIVIGLKKGFVKIIAKPVKFVASISLAFGLCATVANTFVVPYIEEPVSNYVEDFLYENCKEITADNASQELPTILKIAAGMFDIDIDQVASDATGTVIEAVAEKLTAPVINVVAIVIAFIIVLILSNILIAICLAIINAIFKSGPLGILNKSLGVVFGVAFSFILAWGAAVLLNFVMNVPAVNSMPWVSEFSDGGFVYKFLNKYNPIELLLSF